ncbi:P-loop containing nucleoside triphosphate hydrolase protein [Gigaspora margarita]|uniref:P-loop containing nucleoside triphosphate hydrolase protein n=1 Tax=Gigaspora margarita TaxID=4874 RepID=A0A8H3X7V8_GIGMA|nr:P-loop containing nucleoside triphosphate hydrolase protein [Gigaspora margarita]
MVQIANFQYAREASNYVKILNELRSLGAQFAINLPTIVFCGNQSVGKSSLLEAISGVKLPRSDGTCTRCVMELRLIESVKRWSCQLSLRKEYDEHGKRLNRPYETRFGEPINDPDMVELMTRRAQKALLNPEDNGDGFLDWDFGNQSYDEDSRTNALKFTKNVVCIEIKGPDVPNLSLIDLPGIIQHVDRAEDRRFIGLIEELVKDYIRNDQSIIIATITCKDEIENQPIVTYAKEADQGGIRTLGVLTKPDQIEEDTYDIWLKILRGEAYKLDLGYYIVKNPSKKQLNDGITFEEAREAEIRFFETDEPWNRFHMQERIGIKNLQNKLSKLLIKAVKRELPNILRSVNEKLEEVRQRLSGLPKPILLDDPKMELIRMVQTCFTNIKSDIKLWNELNKQFEQFREEFYNLRPIFIVGCIVDEATKKSSPAKFDLLKEKGEYPTIDNGNGPSSSRPNSRPNNNNQLEEIKGSDISDIMKEARGILLPGFIPYPAVAMIINNRKTKWNRPSNDCLNAVHRIMIELVDNTLESTFYRFPKLVILMRNKGRAWLDECKDQAAKQINFTYQMELNTYPYTLDDKLMIDLKMEFFEALREAAKHEITNKTPTDTLNVVASVMAYLKIATKRYVDIIPLTIIHSYVNGFSDRIKEKLMEAFANNNDESINDLAEEDENIKNTRDDLINREKYLKEVLNKLDNFGIVEISEN